MPRERVSRFPIAYNPPIGALQGASVRLRPVGLRSALWRVRVRGTRIDLVAAEPGREDLGVRHLRGVTTVGERQNVAIEDDEIARLADFTVYASITSRSGTLCSGFNAGRPG